MTENKSFVLGQMEFPILPFTLGQLQTLVPLFSTADVSTVSGMASMTTAIHEAVKSSAPEITFAEFQKIEGASVAQLLAAYNKIGVAIGYFRPKTSSKPDGSPEMQAVIAADDERREP